MRRIYICGFNNFPRGAASANYIQYLAFAFVEAGYKVIIVSNINEIERNYMDKLFIRARGNIEIRPVVLSKNRIIHYYDYKFCLTKKIILILRLEELTSSDVVILYSSNCKLVKGVLHFLKKNNIPNGACIVEWYPKEYFGNNKKAYIQYKFMFEKLFTQFDFLLPISRKIEAFFVANSKSKILRLPIMADTEEYPFRQKQTNTTWRIIYPANGRIKDSLDQMIKAMSMLDAKALSRLELHILGVKENNVREILSEKEFERIKERLVIHSWLMYDELIELYNNSHYLLLAREDNQLTQANFPSKVIEVMSHGVVPIVTDVGDYTCLYLRDGYDSLFIRGCSEEKIAEALRVASLMSHSDYLMLSQHSYKTVSDVFDYKKWSARLRIFIESLLGGKYGN